MHQPLKINRKLLRFRGRNRISGVGLLPGIRLAVAMCVLCSLCVSSSAQEPTKSKPKSRKFSARIKQFNKLGRFLDNRISESSGVVMASPDPAGAAESAFWTLNDSGGKPVLYRVGFGGQTEAILSLKGITNRDWESMSSYTVDQKRFLAVGDVGDNVKRHPSCKVHVVAEPQFKTVAGADGKPRVQNLTATPQTIEFVYEGGPINCEAMGFNSEDNTWWFVEKVYVDDRRKKPPGIYLLPNPLIASAKQNGKAKNVARRVADIPIRNVTGMAFSADNQKLAIRTYFGFFLFEKEEGKTWLETIKDAELNTRALPLQSQGEAICFFGDAKSVLLTSEIAGAFIWQVRLDAGKKSTANNVKDKE